MLTILTNYIHIEMYVIGLVKDMKNRQLSDLFCFEN